jgi:hypothetical protein
VGWSGGGRDRKATVCQKVLGIAPPFLLFCFACEDSGSAVCVDNNAEVPLVYKRNRPVGVSGDPFRTATIVKFLNTLRV